VISRHLVEASPENLLKGAPAWFRGLLKDHPGAGQDYEWALRAWGALYSSLWRTSGFANRSVYDKPCQSFVELYAKRLADGFKAIKILKYHTAYAFAYGTSQEELPTSPFEDLTDRPGVWAGGWIYKTLKRVFMKARAGSIKHILVTYDIMNSKNGFPPVPKGFIEKAVEDHESALTKKHPEPVLNAVPEERRRLEFMLVKGKIRFLVRDLFSGKSIDLDEIVVPSLSACYNNSVAEGGSIEKIVREFLAQRKDSLNFAQVEWVSEPVDSSWKPEDGYT